MGSSRAFPDTSLLHQPTFDNENAAGDDMSKVEECLNDATLSSSLDDNSPLKLTQLLPTGPLDNTAAREGDMTKWRTRQGRAA